MLGAHYHQLDFSDTFQNWWLLQRVFGDDNNNDNNNNTLNQGVTLQFSISCVASLPSLRWSWRSRQAKYSACCFLSWKGLNIRPAMLLLQGWEVTLSSLKRVMGATGLSNLNAERCSYLEKRQGKTTHVCEICLCCTKGHTSPTSFMRTFIANKGCKVST